MKLTQKNEKDNNRDTTCVNVMVQINRDKAFNHDIYSAGYVQVYSSSAD